MSTAVTARGLEGIVATNSSICWIDGEAGVLAYRGIDIHELALKSSFEEVTYLLWYGTLPSSSELAEFSRTLAEARVVNPEILKLLEWAPKSATPMEVLRTAVSALSFYDPNEKAVDHTSNLRKAFALTAQVPMIVAMYDRVRKGKPIVEARQVPFACRELPLDAERREALADRDAYLRHRADPARRP